MFSWVSAAASERIAVGYGLVDWDAETSAYKVAVSRTADPQTAADWSFPLSFAPAFNRFPWGDLTAFNGRFALALSTTTIPTQLQMARALTAEPLAAADWSIHTISDAPRDFWFPRITVAHGRLLVTALHTRPDVALDQHALLRALTVEPAGSEDWALTSVNTPRDVPTGGAAASMFASPTADGRIAVSYDSAGLYLISLSDGPW
ncbi:MAG TPA: hypothetical protein VEI97_07980 [bacterium]|nr:hypothetical protein [bacterium]